MPSQPTADDPKPVTDLATADGITAALNAEIARYGREHKAALKTHQVRRKYLRALLAAKKLLDEVEGGKP